MTATDLVMAPLIANKATSTTAAERARSIPRH